MPCHIGLTLLRNSLRRVLNSPSSDVQDVAVGVSALTPPLSIYIHWPYCATICPYCDFNVHKARAVDEGAWREAFKNEMQFAKTLRPDGLVETVYFGGGTPSLMSPILINQILTDIDQTFGISAQAEISMEANPENLTFEALKNFYNAGINRFSLGVQSLDDAALIFLGRRHDSATAIKIFEAAQTIFPKTSLDLIYARPAQTVAMWTAELQLALSLSPQHLSLYELTIEPNTAFGHKARRGDLVPLDENPATVLYELTQDMCNAHGLPAYEVSNHAAKDHACLHNVASWQGADYIGLGPGAHGRLTSQGRRLVTQAITSPSAWLTAVADKGHGWSHIEPLRDDEQQEERLLLGLRLASGLDVDDVHILAQQLNHSALRQFCDDGYLIHDAQGLRATAKGWLVLDYIIGQLRRSE